MIVTSNNVLHLLQRGITVIGSGIQNIYQYDQWKVNDRLFFIRYTFSKFSQAWDFVASKHYRSLEKKLLKNLLWMTVQVTWPFFYFSIQALSFELAGKRRSLRSLLHWSPKCICISPLKPTDIMPQDSSMLNIYIYLYSICNALSKSIRRF